MLDFISAFKKKMEFHQSRMDLYIEGLRLQGYLPENKEAIFKRVAALVKDEPNVERKSLDPFMKSLGIGNYCLEDLIAFLVYYGGTLPAIGVERAWLHAPKRYEAFKAVAAVLDYASELEVDDKINMVLGKNYVPDKKVEYVGGMGRYKVFKCGEFDIQKFNDMREAIGFAREYLDGNKSGLEVVYLRKGVFVWSGLPANQRYRMCNYELDS